LSAGVPSLLAQTSLTLKN